MRTALSIGREPDNDYVIDLPIVSGHHARVTWEGVPGQALIEDLGSSNGTAIGQIDRKVNRAVLMASDTVYFGNHAVPGSELLAWVDPSLAPALTMVGHEMVIGRDPSCQRVIDRSTISGRHVRLKRAGNRIILEDLGSSNGTYVNDRRVDGPTEVQPGDMIILGGNNFRLALGASAASTQRMTAMRPMPSGSGSAPVLPSSSHRPAPTMLVETRSATRAPAPAPAPINHWVQPVTLVALLMQAPMMAIAIGLISIAGGSIPATLFLLGLAALWFGLSTAVFGLLLDPRRPEPATAPDRAGFWLTRGLLLAGLCLLESMLAVVVVFPLGGLQASGLSTLGLLILASWVGLALGFLIVLLAPQPSIAWAGLGIALVALALFGGGPWSFPRAVLPIRLASSVAPSRWAFEGLLVSESTSRPAVDPEGKARTAAGRDLAEDYFPGETDRMGPKADAMALGSMLIGMVGVGLFLVRFSEGRR